jgi:hypothetical protein
MKKIFLRGANTDQSIMTRKRLLKRINILAPLMLGLPCVA